jgi:hypothetical protein
MDTPVFSVRDCLKNQPVEGLSDAKHEPLTGTDEGDDKQEVGEQHNRMESFTAPFTVLRLFTPLKISYEAAKKRG